MWFVLFQGKMHAFLLLGCFVLTTAEYFLTSAHMIPDESLHTNRVVASNAVSQSLDVVPPPVVIVGRFASFNSSDFTSFVKSQPRSNGTVEVCATLDQMAEDIGTKP